VANLSLTREQRERMLPELKRRQAVYKSVEFPSADWPAAQCSRRSSKPSGLAPGALRIRPAGAPG
jgi:hypothetical protein